MGALIDATKTAFGFSLVMFGGNFKNSCQFFHAISSSIPALTNSVNDLKATLCTARETFQKELPELKKEKDQLLSMRSKLVRLESELLDLQKSLNSRSISKSQFESKSKIILIDLIDLRKRMEKIKVSENPVMRIISSVNPSHVTDIVRSMYSSLIVGVAAVQNPTIGYINMGTNVGTIVHDKLDKAINSKLLVTDVHTGQWAKEAPSIISKAIGVFLTYKFQAISPIFSACVLGSQIITGVVEKLFVQSFTDAEDKIPEGMRTKLHAALQASLVAFGCITQLQLSGGAGTQLIPMPFKAVVSPLFAMENILLSKVK